MPSAPKQAAIFMWGKDEAHETAVKITHISIVYYVKYNECDRWFVTS
jgi:hypothetical protein